jgi:serine protease Do
MRTTILAALLVVAGASPALADTRALFESVRDRVVQVQEDDLDGDREDLTRFACRSQLVAGDGVPLKAVLCVRAYRKLAGLYDAVLRAATLDQAHQGLQTSAVLTGLSSASITRFVRRYLEGLGWAR